MKKKEKNFVEIKEELFFRYPKLNCCKEEIEAAHTALLDYYRSGKKVLVAGNGGSAADSEHIIGELMKSFLFIRKLDDGFVSKLEELYQEDGVALAAQLEGGLPTIPLTSMPALSTAYANDTSSEACFAQMTQTLGRKGDVLVGISTSGNSKNILLALMAAKARDTILKYVFQDDALSLIICFVRKQRMPSTIFSLDGGGGFCYN